MAAQYWRKNVKNPYHSKFTVNSSHPMKLLFDARIALAIATRDARLTAISFVADAIYVQSTWGDRLQCPDAMLSVSRP